MWTLFVRALLLAGGTLFLAQAEENGNTVLEDSLFLGYNAHARPGVVLVNVTHRLSIIRVINMHADDHVVSLDVWENLDWTDARLVWNPDRYGGRTAVRAPSSRVWKPDVMLYNSANEYPHYPDPEVDVVIYNNGYVVLYSPRIIHASSCKRANQTHVECRLKFASWMYDGNELDLHPHPFSSVDTDHLDAGFNPEVTYAGSSVEREVMYYACCPDNPYVSLTYTIWLEKHEDNDD